MGVKKYTNSELNKLYRNYLNRYRTKETQREMANPVNPLTKAEFIERFIETKEVYENAGAGLRNDFEVIEKVVEGLQEYSEAQIQAVTIVINNLLKGEYDEDYSNDELARAKQQALTSGNIGVNTSAYYDILKQLEPDREKYDKIFSPEEIIITD